MANWNKEEIAESIRDTLITKHGYQKEGVYVRKPITENYCIGFYHDEESTLCICIDHKEGTQFSPKQKSTILEVLARPEFTGSYTDASVGDSADGRSEIWSTLKLRAFSGWGKPDIVDWVVRLFEHFVNTVNLLELT